MISALSSWHCDMSCWGYRSRTRCCPCLGGVCSLVGKEVRIHKMNFRIIQDKNGQMSNKIHPNGVGEVNCSPGLGSLWWSEGEDITIGRSFPSLCPLRQGEERLGVMPASALGRGGRAGLRRGVKAPSSSPLPRSVGRQCACKMMACLKSEYDIESYHDDQTLKNISPLLRSSINVPRKSRSSYPRLYFSTHN